MSNKLHVTNSILYLSALPTANWNVTVVNSSATRITIRWQDLAPMINESVLYYIALIRNTSGDLLNSVVVSGNTRFANLFRLSPFTKYQFGVIGVKKDYETYESSNVMAWTAEGGKCELSLIPD